MKKFSNKLSKINWKGLFQFSGGIFIALVFCLLVNGFHLDSEFEIIKHTPAPPEEVAIQAKVSDNGTYKININTATATELEEIYGVGEKMAQRIIDHRTQNGEFKQIEDIMKIPGIGKKTFDSMKDLICVK